MENIKIIMIIVNLIILYLIIRLIRFIKLFILLVFRYMKKNHWYKIPWSPLLMKLVAWTHKKY